MSATGLAPFLPRLALRRGLPLHLTFFVTSRCQLACRHCFYASSLNPPRRDELTVAEIARAAPTFGRLLWLAVTGGEPFLRPDLPEVVRVLHRSCGPRVVTLVTNGWEVDAIRDQLPGILEAAPGSLVQLNLSLDGPEAVHDALRGRRGSFARALRSWEVARSLADRFPSLSLGINTAFCAPTEPGLESLSDLVLGELRPRHWDVGWVRPEPRDPSVLRVSEERFIGWLDRLERALLDGALPYHPLPGARLALARHRQQNAHLKAYLRSPRFRVPCLAGSLSAVLYDDGTVAGCEPLPDRLGSLRESGYDVRRIWDGPEVRAFRDRIARSRCHCSHGCNMAVNLLFRPRSVVALPWWVLRTPALIPGRARSRS